MPQILWTIRMGLNLWGLTWVLKWILPCCRERLSWWCFLFLVIFLCKNCLCCIWFSFIILKLIFSFIGGQLELTCPCKESDHTIVINIHLSALPKSIIVKAKHIFMNLYTHTIAYYHMVYHHFEAREIHMKTKRILHLPKCRGAKPTYM